MAELGVIPKEAAKTIWDKARQATFDVERIDEIEREVKHDVIAFLTHVEQLAGPDVRVVDPSGAVARRVQEVLGDAARGTGSLRAFTTGDAAAQGALFSRLLGTPVAVEPVTLGEEKWGQTPFPGGK